MGNRNVWLSHRYHIKQWPVRAIATTNIPHKILYTHGSPPSSSMLGGSSRSSLKRAKRGSWNEKKRAGMSFLIVIAFFAVFALIILTEILMIDDKNKGQSNGMRFGGMNRFGESIPDYDVVKEEYSIEEAVFMRNNRMIREMKRNRSKNRLLLFH